MRIRLLLVLGSVLAGGGLALATVAVATPHGRAVVSPSAIPIGDGHVSSSPRKGYVDSCTTAFPPAMPAATPPWISAASHTWNEDAKVAVQGSVAWPQASYSVTVEGATRVVSTNDLPVDHTTGVFPISPSDPAYVYDQNPNHIAASPTTWTLPSDPTKAHKPSCTNLGPIGVLDDGVLLYNALDANGRDAAAHEVLDGCGGHPDQAPRYHHHDVPSCLMDATSGQSTLVGYAIDGFGIYVERNSKGQLLKNSNLDVCHGRTSTVLWDGKETRIYHYDATLEYPYTVGCFRGTPIRPS